MFNTFIKPPAIDFKMNGKTKCSPIIIQDGNSYQVLPDIWLSSEFMLFQVYLPEHMAPWYKLV